MLSEGLHHCADRLFAELLVAASIGEAWHAKCGSTHASPIWRAEWITNYEYANMRVAASEHLGNLELEWRRRPHRIQHYKDARQQCALHGNPQRFKLTSARCGVQHQNQTEGLRATEGGVADRHPAAQRPALNQFVRITTNVNLP